MVSVWTSLQIIIPVSTVTKCFIHYFSGDEELMNMLPIVDKGELCVMPETTIINNA